MPLPESVGTVITGQHGEGRSNLLEVVVALPQRLNLARMSTLPTPDCCPDGSGSAPFVFNIP